MRNYGVFLTGLEQIEVREMEMPVPAPEEALIEVDSVGICGSDLHFYLEGRIGSNPMAPFPYTLGHECAGTVRQVGDNEQGIRVGDRVCVEPAVPCGRCGFCLSGRYNLCPNHRFLSTPPGNGAMQRYIAFPTRMLHRLPDNVSFPEGAMMEPLAVGASAVRKAAPEPTDTVVILGMGCIGMTTLLCCLERGVHRIIVCDLCENRLEKALAMGAAHAVHAGKAELSAEVDRLTGHQGAQVVFETAGSPSTAAQTSCLVARGGTIVMVGNILKEVPFSFRNTYLKEVTIQSVFRYCGCFPYGIDAVSRGRIALRQLATDVFPYEQAALAFERAAKDKEHIIKALVKMA